MLAAAEGHTAVVRILLGNGADVNRWFEGGNALQMAYDARHSEIVELLLAGADGAVRASIDRAPVSNCPSCSQLNDGKEISHPEWARNILQLASSFVRDGHLAEEGRAAEDTSAELLLASEQLPGFFRCQLRCTACQRRFDLVLGEGGHTGYLGPAREAEG